MYFVGLDDTDTLDTPGTNQLARHLVQHLSACWRGQLITRHQLLLDERIPSTRRNGCVAIKLEPVGPIKSVMSSQSLGAARSLEAAHSVTATTVSELVQAIRIEIMARCLPGSDPGLCIAQGAIPEEITGFGRACQERIVTQQEARELAKRHNIHLEGLGGTEGGVIGALAAVGLCATGNDGRVIYLANSLADHYHITGVQPLDVLMSCGIQDVRELATQQPVTTGQVQVGKRLRPNMRGHRVVLYVSPSTEPGVEWHAERVV